MFEMGAECLCEEILVVQVGGCRGWRKVLYVLLRYCGVMCVKKFRSQLLAEILTQIWEGLPCV